MHQDEAGFDFFILPIILFVFSLFLFVEKLFAEKKSSEKLTSCFVGIFIIRRVLFQLRI